MVPKDPMAGAEGPGAVGHRRAPSPGALVDNRGSSLRRPATVRLTFGIVMRRYHRRHPITGSEMREQLAPAAAMFRSLSDPTRLAILQHLAGSEHRVRDLTDALGMAQSTVSAHLACLRECGLVTSRPQGRASLFSLAAEAELVDVLAATERLLEATGSAVVLCPNDGAVRTPGSTPAADRDTISN